MGYYSNVALVMDQKAYDDFIEKYKYVPKVLAWIFGDGKLERNEKDGSVMCYWCEARWYVSDEDEPGIKAIEDFISSLEETQYTFIRVGEDRDDIVIKGYSSLEFSCDIDRDIHLRKIVDTEDNRKIRVEVYR